MRSFKYVLIVLTMILVISISACDPEGKGRHASGLAQKGPFIQGSSVTIFELSDNLEATGDSYPSEIDNAYGGFDITATLKKDFIEIVTDGYYYNEIAGHTDDNIILRTYAKVPDTEEINNTVNILTTLTQKAYQSSCG